MEQNIKKFVERCNYKKRIVCSIILVLLIMPSISFSLPITVISYNCDLSLDYRSSDYESKMENYSYTGTGAGPEVSHSIILPEYYVGSSDYPVVTAEVSPFDLYVGGAELEMDSNRASVMAEWDFIPNHDDIKIDFERDLIVGFGGVGGRSNIVYSLTDITNDVLLLNSSYQLFPSYDDIEENGDYTFRDYFVDSYELSLSQGNIYRLKMYAGISSSDSASTRIRATFSSSSTPSVPEPSTMLLFGTGLAGLVGVRFRRKKK